MAMGRAIAMPIAIAMPTLSVDVGIAMAMGRARGVWQEGPQYWRHSIKIQLQ